ncbi:preprotein translocase subunit SecE [Candidatus Daviesbacteria bacterium RIFCSPHIGHO2_01_FULL_40_11]|uniref:Protein translocase subunit SecE n=1 Tax=Candidatus Daviesbacteria bacterium RIFCSPHIGHO2_01_FULL_40_11 TaxID=1797762 RepID=A0A1F5JGJ2_9BACT|nr:MAG: preprotein translocase subunit SecE [Candidatus Daviesbacteria bacterium RIFCSPHIGHO2_01_FULL_40_11]
MPNILNFLNEVKEELGKVAWPSREQTIRYTILVILVAIVVGLFLGGLDYILTAMTAFILKQYGR